MDTVNEMKESVIKNFNDKIASPFYGTFIISWLLWNWKTWYITFFVDSNLLHQSMGISKLNYIENLYIFNSWGNAIFSLGHIFVFPFFSSLIIVYLMPEITCRFYDRSLETDNRNRLAKIKREEIFIRAEGKKLEAEGLKLAVEEKVLEKEAIVKSIKSEKSQEETWNDDYEQFKKSNYFNEFNVIKECLYNNSGKTTDSWGNPIVGVNIKAYCNVNELIELSKDKNNHEVIILTEKGRYFMKKFQNDSMI